MTRARAALHQTMAVQHRMDRALCRNLDIREPANQALSDFASTPAGTLALHVQDVVFHLKRKLPAIAIGSPASVRQSLNAAFPVAIEDLIAGLAGDPKFSAEFRHRL